MGTTQLLFFGTAPMERTSPLNALDNSTQGWINGFIGVVIFSGSLPATRLAVMEFDPVFLTMIRAAIAAGVGAASAVAVQGKAPRARSMGAPADRLPRRGDRLPPAHRPGPAIRNLRPFHCVYRPAPLATAMFGVLRGGERPRPVFWVFSILGSALVMGYAFAQGVSAAPAGDLLMLLAVLVCGLGYAEGAKLSRSLGGWQVICWALVVSLPVVLPLGLLLAPPSFAGISLTAWLSLGYVALFSMLIGFVFWYRGLAQGGIAAVGQLQLLQPFFGLALAAGLLHEQVSLGMVLVTVAVIACVAGAKKFAR